VLHLASKVFISVQVFPNCIYFTIVTLNSTSTIISVLTHRGWIKSNTKISQLVWHCYNLQHQLNSKCWNKQLTSNATTMLLTLWEPAFDIFVPRFQPKTSSFWLPYQCHSSSAHCARELFKGSNGLASLLVCTWKKNFWLGVADCLWVTS